MELMRKIVNLSVRPLKDFPGYYIIREGEILKEVKSGKFKKKSRVCNKKE